MSSRAPHGRDDEPIGRFTDVSDRPIYKVSLRAEPGINPIRALRWILKTVLRQYGMRCVDIKQEPPAP